ncbi:hypothetical protein PGT21_033552 [Puccinia graminis f. sp. tritici]|uniref:AAA+ ATPase domain-containing protein n=1 Tax=Puccinia graminis f. sp. tritici TaxID=56615 RepID=A0A5B0QCD7_PUCGR|nr:hypothetical protein PGT21_033552 [Puccinia graminis f. sp. tritici]
MPPDSHSPTTVLLLLTSTMNSSSISAAHQIDTVSSGRPSRNRKPPVTYNPHLPSTRRSKQPEPHHDDNHGIDPLVRTRRAHRVIGNIDNMGFNETHDESKELLNQSNSYSNHMLESEDKDADGEDDDGGDDDEYPSGKADSDSDYCAGNGEQSDPPAQSDDAITVKRSRRTQRVPIDSDDSFSQPRSTTRKARRKPVESDDSDEDEQEEIPSENEEFNDTGSIKQSTSSKDARTQKLEALARQRAIVAREQAGTRRSARNLTIRFGEDPHRNQSNKQAHEEDEGRQLRNRKHVDYHIPALDAFETEDKSKGKKERGRGIRLPMNMSGKQMDRLFAGQRPGADSDEEPTPAFGQVSGAGMLGGASAGPFGAPLLDPGSFAAGGPSNMGKMSGATNLADTDPLGVQTNIDFSHVGGMENHIQQLKEMVSLPLLYPEVFQRFQVTPPRGVLFHGPPGTGKTLLARALAASCSSEGQKISFFMRKGADCLSKWVGEAERQLRLLFEEAKNCQPSIIFFDEIDGLAPVRSSKQEQIHASIVSTLLSLMDGMDGRGQVVIIGATNRPDAVDPALRRPGRFDREFYFPLPNREARLSILNIHTRDWNPPPSEEFKSELAELTKGYGGADLRALCTEAALNAVQRKYPQIYKTSDRLVIDPQSIDVVPRDFTIAQKHLVPSTSRSTANIASPLPSHLKPLLERSFEQVKGLLDKMLPNVKKPNMLEEAEYENDDSGFEKEKTMQTFETLRIFRPRLVVCGSKGAGQQHIGAAILHHLEGYHIQSLDLANLISDSTTSADARCVQIFTEAKRHKPSLLYIPSLHHWQSSPILESVTRTVTSLLDELKASDPILLLAIVDCPFKDLSKDIKSWFGVNRSNRVTLPSPDEAQRTEFFADTIANIRRPPTEFPDALPRKKRILDVLPKAPPREPRKPTESELQSQLAQDQKLIEYLKFRLGPVLAELKKKHKRFTKPINPPPQQPDPQADEDEISKVPKYYDVDLEKMHYKLYYNEYLTSQQFVADVQKIVFNAEQEHERSLSVDHETVVKAQAMLTHTRVMVEQACDHQFDIDCHRMYERMKLRNPLLGQPKKRATPKEKNQPLPERQSSRVCGLEPEIPYDPLFSDRGVKRMISGCDAHTDHERPIKRNKGHQPSSSGSVKDDGAGDENHQTDGAIQESSAHVADIPDSTTPDYEPEPLKVMEPHLSGTIHSAGTLLLTNLFNVDNPQPNGLTHPQTSSTQGKTLNGDWNMQNGDTEPVSPQPQPNGNADIEMNASDQIPQHVNLGPDKDDPVGAPRPVEPPPPAIIPPIIYPDFVCPEQSVQAIHSELVYKTGRLSIDQLEELRAGCWNLIWNFRADFNRSLMIAECLSFIHQYFADILDDQELQNIDDQ